MDTVFFTPALYITVYDQLKVKVKQRRIENRNGNGTTSSTSEKKKRANIIHNKLSGDGGEEMKLPSSCRTTQQHKMLRHAIGKRADGKILVHHRCDYFLAVNTCSHLSKIEEFFFLLPMEGNWSKLWKFSFSILQKSE